MADQRWTKQRVTIKDIAKEAGVDPSTVTRALQNSSRVRQSTRDQIGRIAEQLGYVPSAMARSLVTRRSHLVALIIPDMTNPFFAPLARGIEEEAAKNNLRILIQNTDGQESAERDAIRLFSELAVDGLLVPMARCSTGFYSSLSSAVPIIHINREDAPFHVSCDSTTGAVEVMRHMIELGHTRIGFVNGPAGPAREPKLAAYLDTLNSFGLESAEHDRYDFDGTLQSVDRIADQICATKDRPTAVFAWNDVCAIGLIHALNNRGVSVPADISIAGHDDIEMSGIIRPPLTTVKWPMYELGVNSIRYLLGLRAGYQPKSPAVRAPELIVRDSTAAPPSGRD